MCLFSVQSFSLPLFLSHSVLECVFLFYSLTQFHSVIVVFYTLFHTFFLFFVFFSIHQNHSCSFFFKLFYLCLRMALPLTLVVQSVRHSLFLYFQFCFLFFLWGVTLISFHFLNKPIHASSFTRLLIFLLTTFQRLFLIASQYPAAGIARLFKTSPRRWFSEMCFWEYWHLTKPP